MWRWWLDGARGGGARGGALMAAIILLILTTGVGGSKPKPHATRLAPGLTAPRRHPHHREQHSIRPTSREGANMVAVGLSRYTGSGALGLIMVGGRVGTHRVKDTWAFERTIAPADLSPRGRWQQLQLSQLPVGREGHSLAASGGRIYLWGGTGNGDKMLGDLMVHTVNGWELLQPRKQGIEQRPEPRAWATLSLVLQDGKDNNENNNEATLMLLGGLSGRLVSSSGLGLRSRLTLLDPWLWHTVKKEWSRPAVLGDASTDHPLPRMRHSATVVGGILFLFGGQTSERGEYMGTRGREGRELWAFHNRHTRGGAWAWVDLTSSVPRGIKARSGHAAVAAHDRYLLIVGGRKLSVAPGSGVHHLRDVWRFDSWAAGKGIAWESLSEALPDALGSLPSTMLMNPTAAFLHDVIAVCCSGGGDALAGGGGMHLVKLPFAAVDPKAPLGGHRELAGARTGVGPGGGGGGEAEGVSDNQMSPNFYLTLAAFIASAAAVHLATEWIANNRRRRQQQQRTRRRRGGAAGAASGGMRGHGTGEASGGGGARNAKEEETNDGDYEYDEDGEEDEDVEEDEDDWGGRQEAEAKARRVRATAMFVLERALGGRECEDDDANRGGGDLPGHARGEGEVDGVGVGVAAGHDAKGSGGGGRACTICLAPMQVMSPHHVRWLPCAHAFHRTCIAKWLEMKETCPLCLSPVKAASILKRRTMS